MYSQTGLVAVVVVVVAVVVVVVVEFVLGFPIWLVNFQSFIYDDDVLNAFKIMLLNDFCLVKKNPL